MTSIGIVDYGMGNILSVFNALEMVGAKPILIRSPEALQQADKLILPGVGAFQDCLENLRQREFIAALNEEVLGKKKLILGICLGLQAMAKRSFEGGTFDGLGWFDADVVRIVPQDAKLRVPHIGWNELSYRADCPLFKGLPKHPDCYFVHSYVISCKNPSEVMATCDYGLTLTAAIHRDNIFATQFHPEKSQDIGLTILQNYVRL